MGTRGYLIKKILQTLGTLIFILCFNFFLFRMMPSDPAAIIARSEKLTAQQRVMLTKEMGLDKPLPVQFLIYIKNLSQGKLGLSFEDRLPVTEHISKTLWNTVLLLGVATAMSTALGLVLGIYGGWRRGSAFDSAQLWTSLLFYSMPEWWLGLMLLVLAAGTGWFPVAGMSSTYPVYHGFARVTDILNHMFLPALTITLSYMGQYSLVMRETLLDTLGEHFIITARAKGLRENQVLWRHAVPNALLPSVTMIVLNFAWVLGGAITVETVFTWPGIGLATYNAVTALDYPVLQAIFLLASGAVVLANLSADLIYPYLDPRVKET